MWLYIVLGMGLGLVILLFAFGSTDSSSYYNPDLPADEQIQQALDNGQKLTAIKIYRKANDVSLKEAKNAVEAIQRTHH